jgi:hypothetical protein
MMANELPSKTKEKLCTIIHTGSGQRTLYGGGGLGLVLLIIVIVLVLRR